MTNSSWSTCHVALVTICIAVMPSDGTTTVSRYRGSAEHIWCTCHTGCVALLYNADQCVTACQDVLHKL